MKQDDIVYVTRRATFCASLRLYDPNLSDEENSELYGPCSNPNYHGHDYAVEVTVAGVPDPVTGMVIDLKVLKDIIHEALIEPVDHRNLNLDVDFLKGVIPTSENLCRVFWDRLLPRIKEGELHEVRIHVSNSETTAIRSHR